MARALSGEKMGHFCLPSPLLYLHCAPSSYLCPLSLCYRGWSQQGQWLLSHPPCPFHSSVSAGEAEESLTLCSCLVLALAPLDPRPFPASQCSWPAALLCHLPGTQLYPFSTFFTLKTPSTISNTILWGPIIWTHIGYFWYISAVIMRKLLTILYEQKLWLKG